MNRMVSRAAFRNSSLRHAAIAALWLLGASVTGHRAAAQEGCNTDVVKTGSGPVCGVREDMPGRDGIDVFRGIPYAESVAGARRWTAPRPVKPWRTTRVASRFGASCPQTGFNGPGEEDCLFLNVWRPTGTKASDRLPVMLFVHGGGFYQGSGSDPLYNGSLLAGDGVIVVTINYRLGALGFLAAGDVAGGNYGFLDQQLAMRWVRDSAAAFGGDPKRITLFGESAGAMSIGLHLTSAPASRPLFANAIMESNLLGVPYRDLRAARREASVFGAMATCKDIACLRKMSVKDLMEQSDSFRQSGSMLLPNHLAAVNVWSPSIDGVNIRAPALPVPASASRKPVLIGSNASEGILFLAPFSRGFPRSMYVGWLFDLFGERFIDVLAAYPGKGDDYLGVGSQVFTDYVFACGTQTFAKAFPRARVYEFAEKPSFNVIPIPPCAGQACHTYELPFVFGTADQLDLAGGKKASFTPAETDLSRAMRSYWTNFAKTGDPSVGKPVPAKWPLAAEQGGTKLRLATPIAAAPNKPAQCAVWNKVGYPVRR